MYGFPAAIVASLVIGLASSVTFQSIMERIFA